MTIPTYSTGTVSVSANGTVVSGGSSVIWASPAVKEGDWIAIDGLGVTMILEVTDNSHLVIPQWKGGAKTNVSYVIYNNFSARADRAEIASDLVKQVTALNVEGFIWYVASTRTEPDPSRGDEGQWAYQPSTGKQWHKQGGEWIYDGIFKTLRVQGIWHGSITYTANDVVTLNGTSYLAITASTNITPPNVAYWQVLAAKGDTGPATLKPLVAWATATAYAPGPPADYVTIGGSSYACAVAHTSAAAFATDLAAGRWVVVALKGADAPTFGGTSNTSLTLGTGVKAFVTQNNLAYQSGARVRAASNADGSKWMEGAISYSAGSSALTMSVDKFNGSGTVSDWNFNPAGQPGAGDLSSANNLSDLANKPQALLNLGLRINQAAGVFGTDLNDYVHTGNYRINDNVTNAPFSGSYWFLEVLGDPDPDYISQTLTALVTVGSNSRDQKWFRTKQIGAWGPWRRFDRAFPRGYVSGFNTSNNGSDIVNDIDIQPGMCRSMGDTADIISSTLMTKRLDALWSAGNGGGFRDGGSIADGTWHVFAMSTDAGVCDFIASQSPTAPTLPSGYIHKQLIWSIIRYSSAILPYVQNGDDCSYVTPITNDSIIAPRAWSLLSLTVPNGIVVEPKLSGYLALDAAGGYLNFYIGSVLNGVAGPKYLLGAGGGPNQRYTYVINNGIFTNTAGQIYYEKGGTGAIDYTGLITTGFRYARGQG